MGDSLILLIEERGIDLRFLRSHFKSQVVLLGEVVVVDQFVPPVDIRTVVGPYLMFRIFPAGKHFRGIIILLLCKLRTIRQLHLSIRIGAALSRDQDHSGSSTGSVDSSG